MEGQKVQALIRRRAFCAAFRQSRDFLSLINIYSEHFCRSLRSFKHKYYHKGVKTADLGGHC